MSIWIGSPVDVRQNEKAEKALIDTNDSEFWTDEHGIVSVDDSGSTCQA